MVAMACHRNTGWSAVVILIRVAFLADHLVALAETEASLVGAGAPSSVRLAGALLKRNGTVITAHDYYDFLYRQIHGIEFVEVIDQLIDSSNRGVYRCNLRLTKDTARPMR